MIILVLRVDEHLGLYPSRIHSKEMLNCLGLFMKVIQKAIAW